MRSVRVQDYVRPDRKRTAAVLAALVTFLAAPAAGAQSTGAQSAIAQWESRMVSGGRALCDELGRLENAEESLGHVYYDAQRVFLQIADYTGDQSWEACAQRAEVIYRDRYVLPHRGAVPGYWNFTRGLAMDFVRSGDRASRSAVIFLAERAAFAADTTPLPWTAPADRSREVAYAILSYLDAERVGAPRRARLQPLVNQALGHIEQWFVTRTARLINPFMVGLTTEALIAYHEKTRDARIPRAIALAMDWLWLHAWMPEKEAFWYESTNPTAAAPDLNLLIAPAYAWLYRQTGSSVYRLRADRIFEGGVKFAFLGSGKHFNQNYRWSFDYVKWRR